MSTIHEETSDTIYLFDNFKLIETTAPEDPANRYAGIKVFERVVSDPSKIPHEWIDYGRSIVFKEAEHWNKAARVRSLMAITYWRGLISLSRGLVEGDPLRERGWMISHVSLDKEGKPIFRHPKDDTSGFYRYLVWST